VQKGASREIKPLSPQDHPDIAAALEVVDLEEGPASVNAGDMTSLGAGVMRDKLGTRQGETMSELTTMQPAGTPTWIDLGIPDLDRAMTFYGALFANVTCTPRPRRATARVAAPADGIQRG
jgi:hypothetical protein